MSFLSIYIGNLALANKIFLTCTVHVNKYSVCELVSLRKVYICL